MLRIHLILQGGVLYFQYHLHIHIQVTVRKVPDTWDPFVSVPPQSQPEFSVSPALLTSEWT